MRQRLPCIGFVAFAAFVSAEPAQPFESQAAMSDDVRRMHERLVALSQDEGSISELRIELMDGSGWSHRSFHIESGVLVSKEWSSPGSPMTRREGKVSGPRIARLLAQLIEKRYWTFQGTRFVPDAPTFLFRFYYRELEPVDFRCNADEIERSSARREIRDLFLAFISETEMTIEAPGR